MSQSMWQIGNVWPHFEFNDPSLDDDNHELRNWIWMTYFHWTWSYLWRIHSSSSEEPMTTYIINRMTSGDNERWNDRTSCKQFTLYSVWSDWAISNDVNIMRNETGKNSQFVRWWIQVNSTFIVRSKRFDLTWELSDAWCRSRTILLDTIDLWSEALHKHDEWNFVSRQFDWEWSTINRRVICWKFEHENVKLMSSDWIERSIIVDLFFILHHRHHKFNRSDSITREQKQSTLVDRDTSVIV